MRFVTMRGCSCLVLLCGLIGWAGAGGGGGGGCSSAPRAAAGNSAPHAECLVCKHEADLACLNVKLTDQTPRSVYDGQTYYFCSQECKTKFDREPVKYLGRD